MNLCVKTSELLEIEKQTIFVFQAPKVRSWNTRKTFFRKITRAFQAWD